VGDGERRCAGEGALDVACRRVGNAAVVSVAGELDMLTAPNLRPAVSRFLSEGEYGLLVIDLADVKFLGSSGLKALIDVRDLATERGVPFRLVAAGNRHITRPLEITGLDQELAVYATADDALSDAGADGDVGPTRTKG
jgi:anti-sigma B factor antagonist